MKRKMLSDKQICQVIKDYLHDAVYRYAVMLDGEWGCGKSYFVKKHLEPLIREEGRQVIYISLYGLETTQEIDDTIMLEVLTLKAKNPRLLEKIKFPKRLRSITKIVARQIGKLSENLRGDITTEVFKELGCVNNWFYIFDDLERCPMSATKVLGYINQMVEHDGCKVLIVANEAECRYANEHVNEHQMIASMMIKEYVPTFRYGRIVKDEDNKKDKTLLEIYRLAEDLFAADELYRITREKVIGKTIHFEPELSEIVNGFVQNVFNDATQEEVSTIVEACVEAMNEEKNKNLRTLQYVIAAIRQIYSIIIGLRAEEKTRSSVLWDVTNSMMRTAIRSRTNIRGLAWQIEWNSQSAFDMVNCVPERYRKRSKA